MLLLSPVPSAVALAWTEKGTFLGQRYQGMLGFNYFFLLVTWEGKSAAHPSRQVVCGVAFT